MSFFDNMFFWIVVVGVLFSSIAYVSMTGYILYIMRSASYAGPLIKNTLRFLSVFGLFLLFFSLFFLFRFDIFQ